jgi:glycosyltransferase involved in cell wall biosynthesis
MNNPVNAVVLTLNERENLERCLGSLRWCGRICVVDSGSSDGTCEAAAALGAEVFAHHQEGVFRISDQRNWCLDNCGFPLGSWVLFLDADESIPANLVSEICSATALGGAFDGYEMTPRYLFWGRWLKRTQGFPNWHPRLVRVGSIRFDGGVWEHFSGDSRIGRIVTPYDHYANSKGFSDWLDRHRRYSDWDAEKIVAFLGTGDAASLATTRKLKLRLLAARLWPLRPLARFFHMYFLRSGWLEGKESLVFCLLYTLYEFMVVVKIAERLRIQKQLPL